jgi:dihydrofolate reductase
MDAPQAAEDPVPRLIYYVASSLDGYIADEQGGVDWLPEPVEGDDFGYGEFYAGVDALLMGRRTFDQVIGWGEWPYEGKPCRVLTRRPLESPPEGVEAISGTAHDVREHFLSAGFETTWLVGGAELAELFRQEGMIDEWIVHIIPRTIGGGVPLFGGPENNLQVTNARALSGGTVELRMRRRD